MKFLLPLPIIFFGVMFYVGNQVPEAAVHVKSSTEKNQKKKKHKKDIVYREKVKAADPFMFVKHDEGKSDWDNLRFDSRWHEELFYLLKKLEPDRGEEIYYSYIEEMKSHQHRTKENLTLALNDLSTLNGESGLAPEAEEGRAPASTKDPLDIEQQHEIRVRSILGEHFEIIHEQEKLFLEENPEELTM